MNLFDKLGIDGSYFILGIMIVLIVVLIFCIKLYIKNNKLSKAYYKFLAGADGKSLEASILTRFAMVDELKKETADIKKNIDRISDSLLSSYQHVSLIKYDAFKEMGGKLSFSLCMLDARKNGFILTSMHNSREGCYTYIKEIINGESYVILSEEEKKALSDARDKVIIKK